MPPMNVFLDVPRIAKAGGDAEPPDLDADAANYLQTVKALDGQSLELAVQVAVNDLVKALKAANIWQHLVQLCLLAGPRTAAGCKANLRGGQASDFTTANAIHHRAFGWRSKPGEGWYVDSKVAASSLAMNNASVAAYFGHWQPHMTYIFGSSGFVDGGLCVRGENIGNGNYQVNARGCFQGPAVDAAGLLECGRNTVVVQRSGSASFGSSYALQDATGLNNGTTFSSTSTGNAVAGTIRIGSAPPAIQGESVEAFVPWHAITSGGVISFAAVNALSAYRLAVQTAVPPASKPAMPVLQWGGVPFWYAEGGAGCVCFDRDDHDAYEYRFYSDGVRVPKASVSWRPSAGMQGLVFIGNGYCTVGKTFEVAAWNGAGETRMPPVVIAAGNPPSLFAAKAIGQS